MIAARVLLIEDDDDNRELMAEVLVDAGYEVVTARSGSEGRERLASGAFRLLMSDVGLPDVEGLELAREVRQRWPDVRVLLVTGFADRPDLDAACGREIDAVLRKPLGPDTLVAAVRSVLDEAGG